MYSASQGEREEFLERGEAPLLLSFPPSPEGEGGQRGMGLINKLNLR